MHNTYFLQHPIARQGTVAGMTLALVCWHVHDTLVYTQKSRWHAIAIRELLVRNYDTEYMHHTYFLQYPLF